MHALALIHSEIHQNRRAVVERGRSISTSNPWKCCNIAFGLERGGRESNTRSASVRSASVAKATLWVAATVLQRSRYANLCIT